MDQFEQTVDEICGVLVSLTEEIVQIEPIPVEQVGLITAVKSSVEQVLALAKKTTEDSDSPVGRKIVSSRTVPTSSHSNSEAPESHDEPPANVPPALIDQADNTGRPSTINLPLVPPSSDILVFLQTLDSFPLRLLQSTLAYACFVLETVRLADLYSLFGSVLLFCSKEELIGIFRWYMGPGHRFIYRTSGITWGWQGGMIAPPPHHAIGTHVDVDEHGQCPDFLTIFGVCQ